MSRTRSMQIAAVPVRQASDGGLEVLLVTSRETRRWIVPKGWPMSGLSDHEAAAEEAWEEAGVIGAATSAKLGVYTYDKRDGPGTTRVTVDAYLLCVTEEMPAWPEAAERDRAWFTPQDAADRVTEPGLKALLQGLATKL